jgi:hypothetical protein
MSNLHKSIRAIHTNAVTIHGNAQEDIVAKDINGDKIDINWTLVNSWIDPEQYKYDRIKEYPSIEEQLDMQYHDKINGTTFWQDKINEIKTKYPKV